jgi:hypothetical protein
MNEQDVRQAIQEALEKLVASQPQVEDEEAFAPELYLDCGGGMMIQLSDGSMYEVTLTHVG